MEELFYAYNLHLIYSVLQLDFLEKQRGRETEGRKEERERNSRGKERGRRRRKKRRKGGGEERGGRNGHICQRTACGESPTPPTLYSTWCDLGIAKSV